MRKKKKGESSKELLERFMSDEFDGFMTSFRIIENPAKKCEMYLKVAALITPRTQAIAIEATTGEQSKFDQLFEKESRGISQK